MSITGRYLYASDKLGTLRRSTVVGTWMGILGVTSTWFIHIWGAAPDREYELHDHLGNVRVTPPATLPTAVGKVNLHNYYNYYTFGSYQPYRTFEPQGKYTFGFNSQEKKDDCSIAGGHNHKLYWEYDTRIGRRWNLDSKPYISNALSPNPKIPSILGAIKDKTSNDILDNSIKFQDNGSNLWKH